MNINNDYDYLFKLLIIGDSGVGKSCLMIRFVDDTFTDSFMSTIGIDFKIKTITTSDNKKIKLQIWDTCGAETFRCMTTSYYRGAHGIVICFDLTNKESFENVKEWVDTVYKYCNKDVDIILIGTKSDIPDERTVTSKEAIEYAELNEFPYVETSAKNITNIDKMFNVLTTNIRNRVVKQQLSEKKEENYDDIILNGESIGYSCC